MHPLLQVLGIPVVLIAVASYQVADKLDAAAHAFLTFAVKEQLSLLTILFGFIFAAVSSSHNLGPLLLSGSTSGSGSSGSSKRRLSLPRNDYPLVAMSQVQSDRDKFLCLYPMIRDEILAEMQSQNEMPQAALDWCKEMMDYNVPGGKLNRGTTVVAVLRALQKQPLSPTQLARAAVCGWAIEFLQAFFLVADDVMDDSQTRRGQPCWYKLPHIKLIAINDAFLLESFVFAILKAHFANEPYYHDLVQLMINVIQKTEFGQLLDLTTAAPATTGTTSSSSAVAVDLDRFTLERYKLIVKYKTAYYSFYLPVAMGMLLARVQDPQVYQTAERICCIMGEYFQVQDDYLDCFGDPAVIGKVGTDIQDNKCSWLVVTALNKCQQQIQQQQPQSSSSSSSSYRQILQDNYGQWNDAKVQRVKQLYRDLDLPKEFEAYEEESYKQIQAQLDLLPRQVPRAVFEVLLKKIYKRSM